jgi:hypothetical protein
MAEQNMALAPTARGATIPFAAGEQVGVSSEPAPRAPRTSWRVPIILLVIMLIVGGAVFVVGSMMQPAAVMGTDAQRSALAYRFTYPSDTPADRILFKTSVGITLTHLANKPDKVVLAPVLGERQGSFTWTIIPHQGSRGVRRLLGESEIGGVTYKLCEAISDPASPQPQYAERYFMVNNSGARYTVPQRTDSTPFIDFLTQAIAKVPEGQASVGKPLPADVLALAEKLIPLCTGQ